MMRKPTKNTPGPNADEKRFMGWTKEQGCICCGAEGPSICHHAEGSCFKHNKVLIGHYFVLPLCMTCDRIVTFGSRRKFTDQFGSQAGLWSIHVQNLRFLKESGLHEDIKMPSQDVYEAIIDWGK